MGFVVTGGHAAELLDLAEEVFDQMTPLVHLEIARDRGDPVGFGRDHGGRTPIVQIGANPVAVESFVGQKCAKIEIDQKRGDTGAVVSLARQQNEPHEIAQGIDQRDDLGRKAAAGPPVGLMLRPPFAPVPCWCTRTM